MCAVCFTSAQVLPVAGLLARAVWVSRRDRADAADAADAAPGDDAA